MDTATTIPMNMVALLQSIMLFSWLVGAGSIVLQAYVFPDAISKAIFQEISL